MVEAASRPAQHSETRWTSMRYLNQSKSHTAILDADRGVLASMDLVEPHSQAISHSHFCPRLELGGMQRRSGVRYSLQPLKKHEWPHHGQQLSRAEQADLSSRRNCQYGNSTTLTVSQVQTRRLYLGPGIGSNLRPPDG